MKEYLKCLGKILLILLSYFLLQALVAAAFAAVGGIGAQGDIQAAMAEYIAGNTALISLVNNACVILALALYYRARKSRLCDETLLCPVKPAALWPVLFTAVASALLVCTLLVLLPIPDEAFGEYDSLLQQGNAGSPAVRFIASVVMAPIAEELLFRGVIYGSLKRCSARVTAIMVSCTIFAAMHGNIIWSAYAFCMGVALTLVYDLYCSLTASIVFHMAFNFTGMYLVLLISGEAGMPLLLPLLSAAALPLGIIKMRELCRSCAQ